MDFDQLSIAVKLYQLTVTPYLQVCPRRASAVGSGVDSVTIGDVMGLVHSSIIPLRDIVRFTVIWQEFGFFLFLEHHQRQAPSGAVDPLPRYLQAPLSRLLAQV